MDIEELSETLECYVHNCAISPGHYSIEYHSRTFICELSDQKIKDYAIVTATIYMELEKLVSDGKVTRRDFDSDLSEVEKTLAAFAEKGFLNTAVIKRGIYDVATIRKIDTSSAAWMFIYRTTTCSAIYTIAEAVAKRDTEGQDLAMRTFGKKLSDREWALIFSSSLLRTFLKVEFAN